jgi:hypothetical protein
MRYTFAIIAILTCIWAVLLSLYSIDYQNSIGIGVGIVSAGFAVATALFRKE